MPGTLLFFWDYDTQWGSADWGKFEFENTERLLELHAQYNISACFAVVGAAALPGDRPYHDPTQIRRIHAAGHEVASHSFRHEWLPGLGREMLVETLRQSKDALEQCIGAPVVSFVPPYNQPFDYPWGWSFSLSERRQAGRDRTDLRRLCDALRQTGYRFCRVAYRPIYWRLAERLLGHRLDRLSRLETIAGIACVRLTTAAGFDTRAMTMLNRCAATGGLVVVYGHPHSLRASNSQNETWLMSFLQQARHLHNTGSIRIYLPAELTLAE